MRFCRSAFSKKIVLLLIAAVFLIITGIDLFVLVNQKKPAFKMETPDAYIHLLGIEPDASGTIFDPNGKKLNKTLSTKPLSYFSDDMHIFRTFIFELNKTEKSAPPVSLIVKRAGDGNAVIVNLGWYGPQFIKSDEKTYFYFSLPIPKAEYGIGFGGRRFTKNVNKIVDLTIQYYDGSKSPAQFTFEGPFSEGQILDKDNGIKCTLNIMKNQPDSLNNPNINVQLFLNAPFENCDSLAVYDKSGNRYQADTLGMGGSGSGYGAISTNLYIFFKLTGIPLESIAYITIGERPKQIIYKNVPLYFSK